MRRLGLILLSSILLVASLAAQTARVPGFTVKDPRSLGMGGVFLAISEGCQSLYGNPAGFASKEGELSVLSPAVWTYAPPDADGMGRFLKALDGDDEAARSLLADNGIGAGYQAGIGYSGKGLGLGLYVTQDSFAEKQVVDLSGLSGVVMNSDFQVNIVLGLALPVKFLGMELTVGGNVRPFFHATGEMPMMDSIRAFGSGNLSAIFGQDAVGGFGLAMDLGARMRAGAFTVGLSVRDIAPSFSVSGGALGELLGSWSSGSEAGSFSLTPNVAAGIRYHPDLGDLARFVDPLVLVELQDPVTVIRDGESALNLLHVGVEVKVLNFLSLRAGLNKGWLSAGLGLDLLFMEVGAAVFTEELGDGADRRGRQGMILEAAIRL